MALCETITGQGPRVPQPFAAVVQRASYLSAAQWHEGQAGDKHPIVSILFPLWSLWRSPPFCLSFYTLQLFITLMLIITAGCQRELRRKKCTWLCCSSHLTCVTDAKRWQKVGFDVYMWVVWANCALSNALYCYSLVSTSTWIKSWQSCVTQRCHKNAPVYIVKRLKKNSLESEMATNCLLFPAAPVCLKQELENSPTAVVKRTKWNATSNWRPPGLLW